MSNYLKFVIIVIKAYMYVYFKYLVCLPAQAGKVKFSPLGGSHNPDRPHL